jgi:hypothetical protein
MIFNNWFDCPCRWCDCLIDLILPDSPCWIVQVVVSSETIWPMAVRNLPHHYFFKFFTRTVDAFLQFPHWCRSWFPSTDGAARAASSLFFPRFCRPAVFFIKVGRHWFFGCYVWRGLVEIVLVGFESDSPVIYGMECADSMVIGTMFWNF